MSGQPKIRKINIVKDSLFNRQHGHFPKGSLLLPYLPWGSWLSWKSANGHQLSGASPWQDDPSRAKRFHVCSLFWWWHARRPCLSASSWAEERLVIWKAQGIFIRCTNFQAFWADILWEGLERSGTERNGKSASTKKLMACFNRGWGGEDVKSCHMYAWPFAREYQSWVLWGKLSHKLEMPEPKSLIPISMSEGPRYPKLPKMSVVMMVWFWGLNRAV